MPTVHDQAVCLRVWDWSETSQTVSLFARGAGVLRAVAKGSRRPDARFSGGVEIATRGEMIAIVKPVERSPDAMATLASWDLLEIFPPIRRSLSAFHAGMYALDIVRHGVRDADPHPELFDALVAALRGLGTSDDDARSVLRLQWAALVHTGYRPEFARDVTTGAAIASAPSYTFSPTLGGLIDPSTGRARPGEDRGPLWRVRPETIDALRRLSEGGTDESERVGTTAPEVIDRANRLLAWYLRTVLGTWPASVHPAFPGIARMEP